MSATQRLSAQMNRSSATRGNTYNNQLKWPAGETDSNNGRGVHRHTIQRLKNNFSRISMMNGRSTALQS
eukprot:scaffold21994_cov19-Prasinocladus_malaysianus.AAC.1